MSEDSNGSSKHWLQIFDDRQKKLIHNCQVYAQNPGGMPGHQLALIIAKMAELLHQYTKANKIQAQTIRDHNKFLQEIQDKD